jgi:hypothetical protein
MGRGHLRMERSTMRNGHFILAAAILGLLAFSPTYAQDSATGTIVSGDENGLMSGGGEGGQFPEGTDQCSGSRNHHAHDYPPPGCARRENPHFTTELGGAANDSGAPCQERAKGCDSCYDCCDKQRSEALICHCFEQRCKDLQPEVHRTCRQSCFGQHLDDCNAMP